MDLEVIKTKALESLGIIVVWLQSPAFLSQAAISITAFILAFIVAKLMRQRIAIFHNEPTIGEGWQLRAKKLVYSLRGLLGAFLAIVILALAIKICDAMLGVSWLVKLAQSAALIVFLYALIDRFITLKSLRKLAVWIVIPLVTLVVFGWFDDVVAFLDNISLELGSIRLSLFFIIKAAVFGGILFWLGQSSSKIGQGAIRKQQDFDLPTRELFAKLFQILLFCVVFVLFMQILGLDLTSLTIFGGALGVGLGFGLQQIASNFISGIIILLERSLSIGDYIELEDGKAGILKALNMRSSTLETYDGKEIMVPNEKFITTRFINWTRDDPRQRYEVEFLVAYDTDIRKIPPLIVEAVRQHPQVLDDPELPDCELRGFDTNGVRFAVEFWIEGVDDGKNRVSSDVLFIVWDTLKEVGITIPFPQRDVHIVSGADNLLGSNKAPTQRLPKARKK